MKAFKSLLAAAMVASCIPMNPSLVKAATLNHLGTYDANYEGSTPGEVASTGIDKAFDGVLGQNSRWGTSTYTNLKEPKIVQVNFNNPRDVQRFKITFENRTGVGSKNTNVKHYKVEVKAEGSQTFEKIHENNATDTVNRIEEFTIQEAKRVTSVKLTILEIKDTDWDNVSLEEFEIYGPTTIANEPNVNHMLKATKVEASSEEPGNGYTLSANFVKDGKASANMTTAELDKTRRERWATANNGNVNEHITATFEKTTVVKEIVVDFWRDTNPLDSNVKKFEIVYTDENGQDQTAIPVENKAVAGKDGYQDKVIYTFKNPVKMTKLKLQKFEVKNSEYNNISIEEIQVFSNTQNHSSNTPQTWPTTPEVAPQGSVTTNDYNHVLDATLTASTPEKGNVSFLKDGKTEIENKKELWTDHQANQAFVKVDFTKPTLIEELRFHLFERGSRVNPSNIEKFKIEFTLHDDSTFVTEVRNAGQGSGYKTRIDYQLQNPLYVKSMKLKDFTIKKEHNGHKDDYQHVSINEIEAFSNKNPQDLDAILKTFTGKVLESNVTKLDIPTVREGYEIKFNGCDFEQFISLNKDGKTVDVRHPLVDKKVKVNYEVKYSKTGVAKTSNDVEFTIKGLHTPNTEKNKKPVVIPEIQDWYSDSTAKLNVAELKEVIYNDVSLKPIVEEFVKDYKAFTNTTLVAKEGTSAKAGAIFFDKDTSVSFLGNEGYEMDIQADKIIVKSNHVTGNMYAMQTILQMYKQDNAQFPVGKMQDYPRYEVRGLLLDVARKPVSLEMMKDITRTMRYYKMNDFQPHLSDNLIFLENYGKLENEKEAFKAYEAFRLESSLKNDKGESPTAKDYFITKKDFKEFIQSERALGMNIVPEIDVPAHATSFTKVWPELAVQKQVSQLNHNRPLIDHFDLTKPEARAKILEIFQDYTTGANPTFDKDTVVHVGADEFLANYTSYREWLNEFIPQVKENNTIRMWGGLTWIDDAETDIKKEAVENVQMNLWSKDWADGMSMYKMGYKLINTIDDHGYMVPNGGLGRANAYGDLLNITRVFNDFEVNKVRTSRHGYQYIPSGDDQTLGAAFAIWNDNIDKLSSGLTESDLFWRFFDALPVYAEKTWAATGKEKGNINKLTEVANTVGIAPNTNPYYQEKKDASDNSYETYDFTNKLEDSSKNNRDLTNLTNATIENGALTLNGKTSYVNTPIKQLGNGNTLSFDIKLNKEAKPGEILFEESAPYGTHDIRIMYDGSLGFTRELHEYTFGYKLPVGKKVNVKFVSEQQRTKLYIDNEYIGTASGRFFHNGMEKKTNIPHSTFALPLETIGSKTNAVNATIDNVDVYTSEEIVFVDKFNKKDWTVRAESEYVDPNNQKEGEFSKAFDNNPGTHWHTKYGSNPDKLPHGNNAGTGEGRDGVISAEMTFDQPYYVDEFTFTPRQDSNSGIITKANLWIKTTRDGEWKQVAKEVVFEANRNKKSFTFPLQDVYGVKIDVLDSNDEWIAVSEFGLRSSYEADFTELNKELSEVSKLDQTTYTEETWNALTAAVEEAKALLNNTSAKPAEIEKALSAVKAARKALVCTHAHTEVDGAIKATCTKDGSTGKTVCKTCKHVVAEAKVIEATGHRWMGTGKEPTCGENGRHYAVCQNCYETIDEVLPATGKHTYGEWKVVKEATETEEGLRERICTVCNKKQTEKIAKLPSSTIKPVEPKPETQKPSDSKPNKDETGTGDVTSMSMLASMVVASGASVVGLLKRRNRK